MDLNVIRVRSKEKDGKVKGIWSLAVTKNYGNPKDAVRDYRLR